MTIATTTGILQPRVLPRLYRDSVALMAIASTTEKRDGVIRVGSVMATPANLQILAESEMLPAGLAASADDLVIVVRAETAEAAEAALDAAEQSLTSVESSGNRVERRPSTIDEGIAVALADDADQPPTLATISVPGTYAPLVAERAIRRGMHVFCFSDNVSLDDEVRLKQLAVEHGKLHMGPDCGTAILDGVPLGFANVVREGSIGIVAASGTGAQEVSRLIDFGGGGVSQLIGVGGRDLSSAVGGLMTNLALDLLGDDPDTDVIVVVSKPPATEVAIALLEQLSRIARDGTPTVACFLGAQDTDPEGGMSGVVVRGTLEAGAEAALQLAGFPFDLESPPSAAVPPGRILGLYTGGTLASETKVILKNAGVVSEILDLGDDEYTAGRPHPMIDPETRADRIVAAGADPGVGTILLDLVLGFGASADPATPVATAVRQAREQATASGRDILVVASVCGTAGDPQGLERQRTILAEAGIVLCQTNAAAARLVAQVAS